MQHVKSFRAIAMAAVIGIAAIGAAGFAHAQSTDGGISGTAVEGETVVVKSPDLGIERQLHVAKTGKYTFRHLPIGSYNVIRLGVDGNVVSSQTAEVVVGKTARIM